MIFIKVIGIFIIVVEVHGVVAVIATIHSSSSSSSIIVVFSFSRLSVQTSLNSFQFGNQQLFLVRPLILFNSWNLRTVRQDWDHSWALAQHHFRLSSTLVGEVFSDLGVSRASSSDALLVPNSIVTFDIRRFVFDPVSKEAKRVHDIDRRARQRRRNRRRRRRS